MYRIDRINKAIPRRLFGYGRVQVDGLMQDLSDALARMTEEKVALSSRVKELEARIAEMKDRESVLQSALVSPRQIGDDIRDVAQKEAQIILETARVKADGLLQNANLRLARLMEEAAEAKKAKVRFEMQIKSVINDHLRLLDLNRQESASLEAAARKLAPNEAGEQG